MRSVEQGDHHGLEGERAVKAEEIFSGEAHPETGARLALLAGNETLVEPLGNHAGVDGQASGNFGGSEQAVAARARVRRAEGAGGGDVVLAADGAHAVEGPGEAGGGGETFGVEPVGDLVVGEVLDELAQAVGDVGGRGSAVARARDVERSGSAGVPTDEDAAVAWAGEGIQGNIGDQAAQQAFTLCGGSFEPQGRQIGDEGQDGLAVGCGEGLELARLGLGPFFFKGFELAQADFPILFERSGDQAVVGIDALEAAAGEIGFVASAFQALAPLGEQGLAVGIDLVEGSQGSLQAGGLNRLEEELLDEGVDVSQGEGLAAFVGVLQGGVVADVGGGVGVVDVQQAAAACTDGNALQESRAGAGSAAFPQDALRIECQTLLVALESLPGDVAGERIWVQHGPFCLRDGVVDHLVGVTGNMGAMLLAVGIGAGISRVLEEGIDGERRGAPSAHGRSRRSLRCAEEQSRSRRARRSCERCPGARTRQRRGG